MSGPVWHAHTCAELCCSLYLQTRLFQPRMDQPTGAAVVPALQLMACFIAGVAAKDMHAADQDWLRTSL